MINDILPKAMSNVPMPSVKPTRGLRPISEVVTECAALPVLIEMPKAGVCASAMDGAYYRTIGECAQIVVVGPMHFTPGEYVVALGELLDDEFILYHNDFLGTPNIELRDVVLRRGFANLMARRIAPCHLAP